MFALSLSTALQSGTLGKKEKKKKKKKKKNKHLLVRLKEFRGQQQDMFYMITTIQAV